MTAGDDRVPQVTQNVSAVNGFAYEGIGADVHVFDNGLPLYLLANWQQEPAARSDWLLELPSRMLNARRAVVPFTGRSVELESLREWRDNGPRLAVRWLHGPRWPYPEHGQGDHLGGARNRRSASSNRHGRRYTSQSLVTAGGADPPARLWNAGAGLGFAWVALTGLRACSGEQAAGQLTG